MKWQNHFGLDIGSSSIKLVQVVPGLKNRFKLLALGQVQTPVSADLIGWDREKAAVIKKLVKDSRVNTNQVAISLNESQVYMRVVEMPAMADPDLSSMIRFQAEQYIPVPLADVVLKHQILSTPSVGVPGSKMSVLLVAAPNEILSRYTLMLSNAGLEIAAVDTEILSSARTTVGLEVNPPVTMLVHLGAEVTTMAIFKSDLLMLVQSVSTGGAAIVRGLSSQLSLEFSQAEEYCKSYGLDETKLDGKVAAAIKPVVDIVLGEVRRAIAFYQTREPTENIKRMVLTGGVALFPGMVQYFIENIDLEVQLGDPFDSVDLTESQRKEIDGNGSIFAPAVGLAIKQYD